MSRYSLKTDQNIIDLAIQETGSIEGVIDIIKDNDSVTNIDHIFSFGDSVIIRDEAKDLEIRDFFADRSNLFVSTGDEIISGDYNDDYNDDYFND